MTGSNSFRSLTEGSKAKSIKLVAGKNHFTDTEIVDTATWPNIVVQQDRMLHTMTKKKGT